MLIPQTHSLKIYLTSQGVTQKNALIDLVMQFVQFGCITHPDDVVLLCEILTQTSVSMIISDLKKRGLPEYDSEFQGLVETGE